MIHRLGATVLVLVGLLTWLLLRSTSPSEQMYLEAYSRLETLALNESLLQRDVLNARAGFLGNYDPLVEYLRRMRKAVDELEHQESDLADDDLRNMRRLVEAQAELVERFKTGNALLQNSLAYFDLLSERISESEGDPRFVVAFGGLVSAINRLARDPNPEAIAVITRRLDAIEGRSGPAGVFPDFSGFVLHGRNLAEVLPEVEELMRRLPTLSTAASHRAFEKAAQARRAAQSRRAEIHRIGLYLCALGLLAFLVYLGFRLYRSASALRSRANLERAIGDASNIFLRSQAHETRQRLVEVLRILAEATDADRAYVLYHDAAAGIDIWTRPGAAPVGATPFDLQARFARIDAVLADAEHFTPNDPRLTSLALAPGSMPFWSCAKLVRDDRTVGFLCFERAGEWSAWFTRTSDLLRVIRDVVNNALVRERNSNERRTLRGELRRAQRLEAIGTFTSGVAHNFNNVLNVMQGHAEIALDTTPEDTLAARHLRHSLRAGERARDVVGKILEFGRGARADQRPVRVDDILAETFAQLRSTLAGSVELIATGTANGAFVSGEAGQLQQVMVNLIRNAVDASGANGRVEIEVGAAVVARTRSLSHGSVPAGDYVRIGVSDNGRGMEAAVQARLFEPFFTTRVSGTGLGLATAQEIVRESGGAFDVQSAPGEGSRFEVWLPVVAQAGSQHPSSSPTGGVLLVLGTELKHVLQDEETLAALGFEPVGFTDPAAALASLRSDPQRFDLLIVNWKLRGVSALDVVAQAAKVTPCPIVLSPSALDRVDVGGISAANVADVVWRPWRSNMLATNLRRLLDASPQRSSKP